MTNEEILISITKHWEEICSIKHRVVEMEELCKSINNLSLNIVELSTNVSNTCSRMDTLETFLKGMNNRINELERKPAKKWDSVESVIITTVVGTLIGFLLSNLL